MLKTIGFNGSGSISGQIALLATAAGLNVILSNSPGPDILADLISELGPLARAGTVEDTIRGAGAVSAYRIDSSRISRRKRREMS